MLASRFAIETRLDLAAGGASAQYQGPPRLVTVTPTGLTLNGAPIDAAALPAALDALAENRGQVIVLRSAEGVAVQRFVAAVDALRGAGFTRIAVVE